MSVSSQPASQKTSLSPVSARMMELVAEIAADRPGIGAHRDRLQPHPREGPQIGDEHLVVGMLGAGRVEIEAVGVLHQEFAPAHHAKARPHLVAEFPLDVVEVFGRSR